MNRKLPPVPSLPLFNILSRLGRLYLAAHLNIRHQCGLLSCWFTKRRKTFLWLSKLKRSSHHTRSWCGCCAPNDPQQVDSVRPPSSTHRSCRGPPQNLLPCWSPQSTAFSFSIWSFFLPTRSIFPLCTFLQFHTETLWTLPLFLYPCAALWCATAAKERIQIEKTQCSF